MTALWHRLAAFVTSRKGSWSVVVAGLLVTVAVTGALRGSDGSSATDPLPSDAESARVEQLSKRFPDSELAPVLTVFTRQDGEALSSRDLSAAAESGRALAHEVELAPSEPLVSDDGQAAVISVMIDADRPNTEIADTIEQLRDAASQPAPDNLRVQITGGPAFGADIASAFDGANVTLLAVTIAIVAILLLLTYRSPILWLVPLTVVALAEQLAGAVTGVVGEAVDLPFDAGIISVLVFGAGTNYALLLISRYREELSREGRHREALAAALRATGPAILASNLTVVVSLLALLFASMPNTRGLGVAAAIGLLGALVFSLSVLPAALALCGRRLFWPFVPRVGAQPRIGGCWRRLAGATARRPGLMALVSLVGLAVLAGGLLGTRVGLNQMEQFRVQSESAAGLQVVGEHFPAGETAPLMVIARSAQAERVTGAASDVSGVESVRATGTSPDGLVRLMVIDSAQPGGDASADTVRELRDVVHAIPGAEAMVGGQNAEDLDVREAFQDDLAMIAPLIAGVALLLLIVLLRALVAPLLLVSINLIAAVSAIGAGTWVGTQLFGFPALDVNVPLVAFLFLVALGIDYTIFLVHRIRQEAVAYGTRRGVVEAISHTGAVITSAGVVLAAVFAALGVLPLTTLAQLGLIVGLGVLIDTLVVRGVLAPAVLILVGDRVWWPGTIDPPTRTGEQTPVEGKGHDVGAPC